MPRRPDGSEVPVLHGDEAVAAIEKLEGRKLSPREVRTVHLEGFVPDVYLDSKGIPTYGVGQTGEWMKKSFGESFKHHEDLTRGMIPSYDKLPSGRISYGMSRYPKSMKKGEELVNWAGLVIPAIGADGERGVQPFKE